MSNIIQIEHFAGEKEKMNRQKCTLWLCAGFMMAALPWIMKRSKRMSTNAP